MNPSFVVYIDESGDEGFSFGKGSSNWFVLSAAITRKSTDIETVKMVDRVRAILGKPGKKPLHFRDIRHEHRLPFISEIAKEKIRALSVLIHKPSLKEPEKFRERYRLYFYAVRFLLERISWFCRDHRKEDDQGDGAAQIIFSNRSGMSFEEMRDYIRLLEQKTDIFDVRIEWPYIKADLISAYTPGKRMGLQIADAIASGFFYAVEPSRVGFTEDRYARMLKPIVYHHQGTHLGYGLKFWPKETDGFIVSRKEFEWVGSAYK